MPSSPQIVPQRVTSAPVPDVVGIATIGWTCMAGGNGLPSRRCATTGAAVPSP